MQLRIGLIELGMGLIELGIGLIELGIGLIELGIGLIELGIGLTELGIGLIELGKGLMELGIDLGPCIRPCFFTMAEIHSCQDLSSFHIVIWWSKLGAREPLSYTDRCPQSLKENALK